jgi:hypothetical protein
VHPAAWDRGDRALPRQRQVQEIDRTPCGCGTSDRSPPASPLGVPPPGPGPGLRGQSRAVDAGRSLMAPRGAIATAKHGQSAFVVSPEERCRPASGCGSEAINPAPSRRSQGPSTGADRAFAGHGYGLRHRREGRAARNRGIGDDRARRSAIGG